MIHREVIDNILSTARIEEVVGEFVSLRRRGVNMLGLCPFHNEKTPSFTVSPAKGIFKCFGCGKAGNVVNFLMEHEHFSYPEALKYLARKYNIEVEEEEQTPEQIQELNEKESLFNLNFFALQYFSRQLLETEEGKAIGLSYFKERGIREDLIRKFQLGYNPKRRDAFSKHALENGYNKTYLVKTGLSVESENQLHDRFHERVIFPIHSASGRVLGFGGRILSTEKNRPKYVNSPESEIYNKSKTLYGIYFAKTAIIANDNCHLVEGYTDVIALHQAGIENVVASSGTSLTHDQVNMIRRYSSNITLLYDGDPAGIKASFRGIDLIVEQGMNVKIVLFPDGEDPDSYSRKHHPEEVRSFIAVKAANFILFKTKLLLDETQNDPIRKAALIKEIVLTISLIPDGISRSLYIRECSALMDVPEQILMNELNKKLREKFKKENPDLAKETDALPVSPAEPVPIQPLDPNSAEYQEKELIRLLLLYGQEMIRLPDGNDPPQEIEVIVADVVIHLILSDELSFENATYQKIFNEFVKAREKETTPERDFFTGHPDREVANTAVDLIFSPYELSRNWIKNNIMVETETSRLQMHIRHSVLAFKSKKIEQMITGIQQKLSGPITPEEQKTLLVTLRELKEQSIRINNQGLGRIITH